MKNVIICKNCNSENPHYGLICRSCKFYLRERIYNIDLWRTISRIIDTPSKAFRDIIFSEHKNYLILLIILISGKLFLNGIFLTMFFNKWNASLPGFFQSYIIILIFTVLIIYFYAVLFTQVTKRFGVKTLNKDNFSLIVFSFLPYTFSLLFLFTLEMVIFGETLFYYDPSPFILKGTIAYIFLTFECLMILWSFFLSFTAFKVQSKSSIYSVVFSILMHLSIYIFLYYISAVIYL